MKIEQLSAISPEILSDLEEVCRLASERKKPDPELDRRVEERAERVRNAILEEHGVLDIGVPIIRQLRDGA